MEGEGRSPPQSPMGVQRAAEEEEGGQWGLQVVPARGAGEGAAHQGGVLKGKREDITGLCPPPPSLSHSLP